MTLPDPPSASFASDNAAGVSRAVLDALVEANTPAAMAYGADPWTGALRQAMRDLFDAPVRSLVCWGGTGANVVGLGSVLHPWQAVVCVEEAHIAVDEGGAPTRFTGSMLLTVPSEDGKLRPDALERFGTWRGVEHHPQPAVVSISQVTELGTVYSVDEIAALADAAHAAGLLVHVDGARIANAVVASGAGVVPMLRDTGVDLMTFGATKNGAMYGEVVVFLRPELAEHARFVRKQAAQLPSKARFISAQILALLAEDLWLANAAHANDMATLLAGRVAPVGGVDLVRPPEANSLFVRLPREAIDELQAWSFFWDWEPAENLVRWMTSFVTTPDDVDRFVAGVSQVMDTQTQGPT